MSSTTDRRRNAQILVLFAGGLVAILAIAALVFDVGQNLLEKRKQQNASDAAALAGARWLLEPGCKATNTNAACPAAVNAALAITSQHGYDPAQVVVNIPPASGPFAGRTGHIQVTINSNRDSYFAGALGISEFDIGAMAVAANGDKYALPFSFLALDPDGCKSGHLHGNADMTIEGDLMVLSDCEDPGSLSFDGSNLNVSVDGSCSTVGEIDYPPPSDPDAVDCGTTAEHVPPIADPLAGLGAPLIGTTVVPDPPTAPQIVASTDSVSMGGCPGQPGAGTEATPAACVISATGSPSATATVRIYPGVYWGGIDLNPNRLTNIIMEPGIYYMAGGGFNVTNTGGSVRITIRSVDAGTTTTGGGILVYNDDSPTHREECIAGTAASPLMCIDEIDFQNTKANTVDFQSYEGPVYEGLIFVQDRDASSQPPMKLTGNANMGLNGTIYLPEAQFDFEGNGAGDILNAQVICWSFDVGGNGSVDITYDPDDAIQLPGIGLVQ